MFPSTAHADAGALECRALKASLMTLLEERHRQAELWLQNHHEALRRAVEVALPEPEPLPPQEQQFLETQLFVVDPNHVDKASAGHAVDPDTAEKTSVISMVDPNHPERNSQHSTRKASDEGSGEDQVEETAPVVEYASLWAKFSKEQNATLMETLIGILIILNTLVMFVQLEFDGRKASAIFMEDDVPDTPIRDMLFDLLGHFFNAIFVVELLVKMYIYKGGYFQSAFDLFDVGIVVVTSVDLYILSNVQKRTRNISFLRTMRLLRLARLLRIIRMMNVFQELRVLLHTMVLSFLSVFWSMLILLLFMLVTSLLLSQLIQDHVANGSNDENATRAWADRYYGTSSKALYTVFEMTFSGCWPNYARKLIEEVSPWYAAFFIPYVTLVIFTLIRLIYALLLKDTLQAAANDVNLVVQDRMKEVKGLVKKLSDLFEEADIGGDGYLGREEFDRILKLTRVQTWMGALGLNAQDTEQLFDILDDGENPNGLISRKAFVNGILRIKGHAQKQDLLVAARDAHRVLDHCKFMREEVKDLRRLFSIQLETAASATGNAAPVTVSGNAAPVTVSL